MPNVKSYAWAQILHEPVPMGADALVHTPGFIDPPSYKTDETEVVHGADVLTPEEFALTWADDFATCSVTNNTAADWAQGDTVYVTVPGTPFDASEVEGSFAALEARVTTNEANIATLDSRVAALEVAAGGAAGALAGSGGLRQGPATSHEPKHKGKADHDKDEEKAKPKAKAGEAHWNPSDIDEAAEEEMEEGNGRRKGVKKHK